MQASRPNKKKLENCEKYLYCLLLIILTKIILIQIPQFVHRPSQALPPNLLASNLFLQNAAHVHANAIAASQGIAPNELS